MRVFVPATLLASFLAPLVRPATPERDVVAVRAGTVHLVEGGRVLEGGATVLVRDGRIVSVGKAVAIPPDAEVVDYGLDAVIVPGLVAAKSPYATGMPSLRTAAPGLRAVDAFDSFGRYAAALSGGVTSAYVAPAEGRLVAGQGALVKLAGESDQAQRVIAESAAIQGAVDRSARDAPGYWEPPIPATAETGMGYARAQFPRSTMGAILALRELIAAARSGELQGGAAQEYGEEAVRDLAPLLERDVPWRVAVDEPEQVRALLELAREEDLPLVLEGWVGLAESAEELAAAGVGVVFRVPFRPNVLADPGKERDARWPRYDVPAELVAAGVPVAIAAPAPKDTLAAAALASAGGLSEAAALRSITLTPAELFGGAQRVGSIAPGKDADLVVLNGPPLSGRSSVLATWSDGEPVWVAHEPRSTVVAVDELHVGDGTVLRPGELLMSEGRILEVGQRVSRPRGATLVRATACMPGLIDALGHLGLEGTRKVPPVHFSMGRIVGPGDRVAAKVARRGITTVVLSPRQASKDGAPMLAYKPAALEHERQVVADPVGLRLKWSEENRLESGEKVRELLEKAAAYRQEWIEYEEALAAWTPPAEPAAKSDDEDEGQDEGEDEDAQGEEDGEDRAEGEDDPEPTPLGVWELRSPAADAQEGEDDTEGDEDEDGDGEQDEDEGDERPAEGEAGPPQPIGKLRVFSLEEGDVRASLRSDALSSDLVPLEGVFDAEAGSLELAGIGSEGWVRLEARLEEATLAGTVSAGELERAFTAERTAREVRIAGRRRGLPQEEEEEEEEEESKPPKGKPKEPKLEEDLEPLRAALAGELALVVEVDRADEVLECVAAFEEHGIQPILLGAEDAWRVADRLAGRVAGLLLTHEMLVAEPERGTDYRTPWADLQNEGLPVVFHSSAEEGAALLPTAALYAIANGMSPEGALRALTSDAARAMSIEDRVGRLARGLDADVVLLDGPPLAPATSILRTWVNGKEVLEP